VNRDGKNHLGNLLTILRGQLQSELAPDISDLTLTSTPTFPLTAGPKPQKVMLEGKKVRLVPMDIEKHADELFKISHVKPGMVIDLQISATDIN